MNVTKGVVLFMVVWTLLGCSSHVSEGKLVDQAYTGTVPDSRAVSLGFNWGPSGQRVSLVKVSDVEQVPGRDYTTNQPVRGTEPAVITFVNAAPGSTYAIVVQAVE